MQQMKINTVKIHWPIRLNETDISLEDTVEGNCRMKRLKTSENTQRKSIRQSACCLWFPSLTLAKLQCTFLSTATYKNPGFTFLNRTCICMEALTGISDEKINPCMHHCCISAIVYPSRGVYGISNTAKCNIFLVKHLLCMSYSSSW